MSRIFSFGDTVAGYEVPVLNEREVRAAAGILFFFALVSFMNSWLMGNFRLTRIFVIAFVNFPNTPDTPAGARGELTTTDVQSVLNGLMK